MSTLLPLRSAWGVAVVLVVLMSARDGSIGGGGVEAKSWKKKCKPIFDCWIDHEDGSWSAYFGYHNYWDHLVDLDFEDGDAQIIVNGGSDSVMRGEWPRRYHMPDKHHPCRDSSWNSKSKRGLTLPYPYNPIVVRFKKHVSYVEWWLFGQKLVLYWPWINAWKCPKQPPKIRPILECTEDNGDGTWTAHYGYENLVGRTVDLADERKSTQVVRGGGHIVSGSFPMIYTMPDANDPNRPDGLPAGRSTPYPYNAFSVTWNKYHPKKKRKVRWTLYDDTVHAYYPIRESQRCQAPPPVDIEIDAAIVTLAVTHDLLDAGVIRVYTRTPAPFKLREPAVTAKPAGVEIASIVEDTTYTPQVPCPSSGDDPCEQYWLIKVDPAAGFGSARCNINGDYRLGFEARSQKNPAQLGTLSTVPLKIESLGDCVTLEDKVDLTVNVSSYNDEQLYTLQQEFIEEQQVYVRLDAETTKLQVTGAHVSYIELFAHNLQPIVLFDDDTITQAGIDTSLTFIAANTTGSATASSAFTFKARHSVIQVEQDKSVTLYVRCRLRLSYLREQNAQAALLPVESTLDTLFSGPLRMFFASPNTTESIFVSPMDVIVEPIELWQVIVGGVVVMFISVMCVLGAIRRRKERMIDMLAEERRRVRMELKMVKAHMTRTASRRALFDIDEKRTLDRHSGSFSSLFSATTTTTTQQQQASSSPSSGSGSGSSTTTKTTTSPPSGNRRTVSPPTPMARSSSVRSDSSVRSSDSDYDMASAAYLQAMRPSGGSSSDVLAADTETDDMAARIAQSRARALALVQANLKAVENEHKAAAIAAATGMAERTRYSLASHHTVRPGQSMDPRDYVYRRGRGTSQSATSESEDERFAPATGRPAAPLSVQDDDVVSIASSSASLHGTFAIRTHPLSGPASAPRYRSSTPAEADWSGDDEDAFGVIGERSWHETNDNTTASVVASVAAGDTNETNNFDGDSDFDGDVPPPPPPPPPLNE